MGSDTLVYLVRFGIRHEHFAGIALRKHVDVAFRHERILRSNRQPVVDFRDHAACRGDERRNEIRYHAYREVTWPGVRFYAKKQGVDANGARSHKRWHR